MGWREDVKFGIMRADRIFYGTSNGGLGSELSTTELGWLDGITPGTAAASKALVLDANADITGGIRNFNVDGDLSSDQDITAGVDDTTYGRIYIYGGTTTQGGFMRLYTAADMDTTDEFASINVTSEEMWLGFENDLDQLVLYGTGHSSFASEFHATVATVLESTLDVQGQMQVSDGALALGQDDAANGALTIYGDSTNNGAIINLYNAAGEDTTHEYYRIEADDDLKFLADTTEFMRWDNGDEALIVYSAGGIIVGAQDLTSYGQVVLTGGPAATAEGGTVVLHTSADHDAGVDDYLIQVYEDDLRIGPDTDPDAILYNGSTNNITMSNSGGLTLNHGALVVGVNDSQSGLITVYGDGTTQGGRVWLVNAANEDTTTDYWQLESNSDFEIGDTTNVALRLKTSTRALELPYGLAEVGAAAQEGLVTVHGAATGSTQGGEINLMAADDHDTTIASYNIQVYEDDLRIGPSNNEDALQYLGATASWQFSDAVTFSQNFTYGGTTVTANGAELNYLDIAALGTGAASKAVVLDANGDFVFPATTTAIDFDTNSAVVNLGEGDWQINSVAVTATAAELNYLDLAALGTGANSKAVVLDANGDYIFPAGTSGIDMATNSTTLKLGASDWQIDGTDVSASAAELNTKEFTVQIEDCSGNPVIYVPCPVAGNVTRIDTVVSGDPGGNGTVTGSVNGGAAMNGVVTVANGASAGDRDSGTPSTNNTVAAGDAIYLTTAAFVNAVKLYITVTVTL